MRESGFAVIDVEDSGRVVAVYRTLDGAARVCRGTSWKVRHATRSEFLAARRENRRIRRMLAAAEK